MLPTSVVPDSEVAAVGSIWSKAEEKLVSRCRLVGIDSTHRLDPLSEKPASIKMNISVGLNELGAVIEWENVFGVRGFIHRDSTVPLVSVPNKPLISLSATQLVK